MIKSFLAKINLNTKSMLKYGTIANLTVLLIIVLLGEDNVMLAFPITLTAIALSFENLNIKPIYKIIRLLLIDCLLVTLSFISSLYPYTGIIINFITIFFISYFLTVRYNPKIYKPFIMLYVFTSFSTPALSSYINRLLVIFLGIFIVVMFILISSLFNKKEFIKDTLCHPLSLFSEQLNSLSNGLFDEKIYSNISKELRGLCYKIYTTRYRNNLTTNLGKINFDIYIILGKLHIYLKEFSLNNNYNNNFSLELRVFFGELKILIDSILKKIETDDSSENILKDLDIFISLYSDISYYNYLISILKELQNSIKELYSLNKKDINKKYITWKRSDIDRIKNYFINNFYFGSIRLNFALRISITLSLTIFLGNIYSIYKFIWVAITIMSVMQPYYEDTISKGKERLKGNFIGIFFLITVLTISDNKYLTMIILVISLYLTYGFKEYYKLSTFTAMASISVASLSTSLNVIAIHRIIFILLGVIIVIIANKFLFPYKLKTGIYHLITKLFKYNYFLIDAYIKDNQIRIRDLIILSTLSSDKLYMRNLEFKDNRVNLIIEETNKTFINIGYNELILKKEHQS
ncbi:FUSC family protein [Clostridium sardiniense]|uniref:FUSC family protein n=1 Tax=Clostridium sardiniense TaxID=29369 RepID=UPI003D351302